MFVHNINPVLIHFFSFEIRWYGLIYALGFVLGLFWMLWYREELGLTKDEVYDFLLYLVIGVVVGARLFHVIFWEPSYYLSNPLKVFAVWEGGMAFHGGLVGILIAGWWFIKKKKMNFYKTADILTVPAIIGLAFGRIGNFINGELFGPVTSLPWGVDFGDGEFRHPYQIYAALKRFAIAGVLAWMLYTKKFKDGFVFWTMILLMGAGRLWLDFYRVDVRYLGLSVGQWMSLAMVIIALYFIWKNHKNDLGKLFKSNKILSPDDNV